MIILSDFNATMCNQMDRSNNSKFLEVPKLFKEYMELFQLLDVWRVKYPGKQDYTYFSKTHLSHSRIYYILCSTGLAEDVISASLGDCIVSDHAYISIVIGHR